MWVSRYFVYFILLSFLGWVYETIYCTIKSAHWDNRGFLYGPVCPIYGAGGVSLMALMDVFSEKPFEYGYTWQQVFIVAFFGSIALEYATSWGLERLFHAYWWDYSDMPFNIQGRVCLPCSIGFGCAGLLVVYVIAPFVWDITDQISPLGFEVISLVFMCTISVDITLTVSALTHFEAMVETMDEHLNTHMEQFVEAIAEKGKAAAAAVAEHPLSRESWAEDREWIAAKIAEERKRFSRESREHVFQSMGGFSRSALRRVRGFRRPTKTSALHMEEALAQLKEHMPGKK